jgi:hypothetical protein
MVVDVVPDALAGCWAWQVALVVGEGCILVGEERQPRRG